MSGAKSGVLLYVGLMFAPTKPLELALKRRQPLSIGLRERAENG